MDSLETCEKPKYSPWQMNLIHFKQAVLAKGTIRVTSICGVAMTTPTKCIIDHLDNIRIIVNWPPEIEASYKPMFDPTYGYYFYIMSDSGGLTNDASNGGLAHLTFTYGHYERYEVPRSKFNPEYDGQLAQLLTESPPLDLKEFEDGVDYESDDS